MVMIDRQQRSVSRHDAPDSWSFHQYEEARLVAKLEVARDRRRAALCADRMSTLAQR
jgi:hypothetical protein